MTGISIKLRQSSALPLKVVYKEGDASKTAIFAYLGTIVLSTMRQYFLRIGSTVIFHSPILFLARIHCSIEDESVNCFLDQNSLVDFITPRRWRLLSTHSWKQYLICHRDLKNTQKNSNLKLHTVESRYKDSRYKDKSRYKDIFSAYQFFSTQKVSL